MSEIEITRYDIELWISEVATGEFHYKDIKGLRSVLTPESDNKLRKVIHDICHAEDPICESIGKNDGRYRPIEKLPDPEDWQLTDATRDFPVILPFDLRRWVWIDPGTMMIVAGSKDSGKSGLIMRTTAINGPKINTILLSNMEGGKNQLKRRFGAMDIDIPNPAPFKVYQVMDNFHDHIKEPNTFYAIDYIDVPESGEFYMIAPALAKIQGKLTKLNSVAMVGLQKRTSSDTAFGGEQTLKKAGLYLAINPNKLKIVSAKIWTDPKVNPRNMQWTFLYDDEGTKFTNIQPFYGED